MVIDAIRALYDQSKILFLYESIYAMTIEKFLYLKIHTYIFLNFPYYTQLFGTLGIAESAYAVVLNGFKSNSSLSATVITILTLIGPFDDSSAVALSVSFSAVILSDPFPLFLILPSRLLELSCPVW